MLAAPAKPLYAFRPARNTLTVPKACCLLLCALLVWCCVDAPAASVAPPASPYWIDVWETDDGLPQSSILSMVQTRDGYLWLGTLAGLVRFDGVRFTVFDPNNTPGLTDGRVVCLFEDSRRNLWIGTDDGSVFTFKDGRVSTPPNLAKRAGDGRLRAAAEDRLGTVWLLFENALWRYGSEPTRFPLPSNSGRALFQEVNGPLWLGTRSGQYAITNQSESSATSPQLPIVHGLTQDAQRLDALAPGRREGYWRLADGLARRVVGGVARDVGAYPLPPPPESEIKAAREDGEGNLVVGTPKGIYWLAPDGKVNWLTETNGLSWPYVSSLLVDREGTLWIGTDGGGLYRVQRKRFETLEPFRNWTVQSVTEDKDGMLWIASNGSGLGRYANGSNDALLPFLTFFRAVFADKDNQIWISLPRGDLGDLIVWRAGNVSGVDTRGLLRHLVRAIHQDRAGRVWFGSEGNLVRFESNTWTAFTTRDGLSADHITAIADDPGGGIWIGTRGGGVNLFRDGKFTVFRQSDGAPGDDISGLLMDSDGVLWVSTFTSGLGRFEKGRWNRYTTREGLTSNNLGYLLEDERGNLWIGSNKGLLRVPRKALNDLARGFLNFVPCRAYGKTDGLPSGECSSVSQPGAWRGRNGKLWFSTIKGVAGLNPENLRPNTNPPPVIIESVLVDNVVGTPIRLQNSSSETLTLQPSDERLEVQYTSLNLSAPERARFQYRLQGFEDEWIEAGNARVVRYTKLPPGQYTFQVKASNEDGVWNETGASLGISVLPPPPPFWRTWWFLTFAPLVLIACIIGVVHYLSTQKLQRQLAVMRQQEALEKERARIARDIHDQVGASLTQLALLGELVETDKDSPVEVESHAQQICQSARETTRALDEIVWTVNPQNDTLEGLVNYICKNAQDYLAVAGVRYRFDVPSEVPAIPIPPDVRHNVFLASKEAVTNVVRHAKATSAWVRMKLENNLFTVEIEDNGRGVADLDINAPRTRNGLKNMRKRMEDVGGTFSLTPGTEGGALAKFTVPLPKIAPSPAPLTSS